MDIEALLEVRKCVVEGGSCSTSPSRRGRVKRRMPRIVGCFCTQNSIIQAPSANSWIPFLPSSALQRMVKFSVSKREVTVSHLDQRASHWYAYPLFITSFEMIKLTVSTVSHCKGAIKTTPASPRLIPVALPTVPRSAMAVSSFFKRSSGHALQRYFIADNSQGTHIRSRRQLGHVSFPRRRPPRDRDACLLLCAFEPRERGSR
jgi:hypothetical protein